MNEVEYFMSVTNCSASVAEHLLETSDGDVDTAILRYFEEQNTQPVVAAAAAAAEHPRPAQKSTRFATIKDLHEDDEDNSEGRQGFYAGGSTSSGQQILGSKKGELDDVVKSMFQKARDNGARDMDIIREERRAAVASKSRFGGQGYRLGDGENEDVDASSTTTSSAPPQIRSTVFVDDEPLTREIFFWSNGFSIDNGPLRRFDDKANEQFLNEINMGFAPTELQDTTGIGFRGNVAINLIDRRMEEYAPPKVILKPFSGSGHKLGSPAPDIVKPELTESSTTASTSATNDTSSGVSVLVNNDQPITSLQIRLADGTRLVGQFNHSHTIGDIYGFVRASRSNTPPFSLMTTFPNKELVNMTDTVASAGLLNAVVVQKMK